MEDFSRTDYSNYDGKRFPHIQVWERSDLDCAISRVAKIPLLYRRAIEEKRKIINAHMKGLYGRDLKFPDHEMGIMTISIKDLIADTGMSPKDIGNTIRRYMGEKTPLFREKENKRIPIEFDRIKMALSSVKAGKGKQEIKEILYK